MYFQLVDNQVLSTQGQPDVFNLHRLTARLHPRRTPGFDTEVDAEADAEADAEVDAEADTSSILATCARSSSAFSASM